MSTTKKSCITLDGVEIEWSFVSRIRKFCAGDWERTKDAFWKAHKAGCKDKQSIIRYLQKGLVPDEHGNRYTLKPSMEFETKQGRDIITNWWELQRKMNTGGKKQPEQIRASLKSLFTELANAL